MKTIHLLLINYILLAVTSFLYSFQNSIYEFQHKEFLNLVLSNQITCKAKSIGGFSGKCIQLDIKNNTSNGLRIKIARGTSFFPKNKNEQTLITMEDQFISINSNQKSTSTINGYCSESHDASPSKNSTFTFSKDKRVKFDSLFNYMDGLKIPLSSFQNIVWAVSDNSPVSNIPISTEDLKKLRDYLFKFTNQKETSFVRNTYSIINPDGTIKTLPFLIEGELEFTVDESTCIDQKIYSKDGVFIEQIPLSFSVLAGKTKFSFALNVKKWKEGEYTLKIFSKKNLIKTYDFEI